MTEQGGTYTLEAMEKQVRIQKESNHASSSPTGDSRGMDKSGHRKKGTRALTSWRQQMEGQVRTWKESDQARGTYPLETRKEGQVMT